MSRLTGAWRRLRWLSGRGWREQDFSARYRGAGDVWGYDASGEHRQRADWIMDALPEGRFRLALEAGCAQGFLTERLAARADRLVACDFSPEAVEATRRRLASAAHVECRVADIRDRFPATDFELGLFSDVLYYLSKRETDAVLAEAGRCIAPGGHLLVANEWKDARGLTPPDYAFGRLDAHPSWARVAQTRRPFGAGAFVLGLYRREK